MEKDHFSQVYNQKSDMRAVSPLKPTHFLSTAVNVNGHHTSLGERMEM